MARARKDTRVCARLDALAARWQEAGKYPKRVRINEAAWKKLCGETMPGVEPDVLKPGAIWTLPGGGQIPVIVTERMVRQALRFEG